MHLHGCRGRTMILNPRNITPTGICKPSCRETNFRSGCNYIHQQARSVFEEQGYSVLYLALGFLEWIESASAESRHRAPLMLIPVELERQKVRTRFNLKWSGAELSPTSLAGGKTR